MAPPISSLDDQEQDGIRNDTTQATNNFYTPAAFTITDLPPIYSQLQPLTWQHHSSDAMNITASRSWETDKIINNHGPVLFDWYSSSVAPWDMQHPNLNITSEAGQSMAFQPYPFYSGFQEQPRRFEKSDGLSQAWQSSYRAQETSCVDEEVPRFSNASGMLASNLPVTVETASLGRASKRRRRSSTSSVDLRFAPNFVDSTQPSPVECSGQDHAPEQYRHIPTSTIHAPAYTSPVVRGLPRNSSAQIDDFGEGSSLLIASPQCTMPTAEVGHTSLVAVAQICPILTPSVRVISDRRESIPKLRRGGDAVFKTQSDNTKRGHYASEVWESHKSAIKKMYIDEGKPLREVISSMEKDHNFLAT